MSALLLLFPRLVSVGCLYEKYYWFQIFFNFPHKKVSPFSLFMCLCDALSRCIWFFVRLQLLTVQHEISWIDNVIYCMLISFMSFMFEVVFSNKNECLLDFSRTSILVEIECVHSSDSIKTNLKSCLITMHIAIKFFALKDKIQITK